MRPSVVWWTRPMRLSRSDASLNVNFVRRYYVIIIRRRSDSPVSCAVWKMKRVIELIRVSTEAQARDDRASIPAQRAANRRTAQAYSLEIVRTIEYADVSGAAVLLAPEMQLLLGQIGRASC